MSAGQVDVVACLTLRFLFFFFFFGGGAIFKWMWVKTNGTILG